MKKVQPVQGVMIAGKFFPQAIQQPTKSIENNDVVMFRNRPISIRDVQAFYNERNRQRKAISQMNIIKSKRSKSKCQGCIGQIETNEPCLYFDYIDNSSDSEPTDELLEHNPFKNKFGTYLQRHGLNNFNPNKYRSPYINKGINQKQYLITPHTGVSKKQAKPRSQSAQRQQLRSASNNQKASKLNSKKHSQVQFKEMSSSNDTSNSSPQNFIPSLRKKPNEQQTKTQVELLQEELEVEQLKQKIQQQQIYQKLQNDYAMNQNQAIQHLLHEKQRLSSELLTTRSREEFAFIKQKLAVNQQMIDSLMRNCEKNAQMAILPMQTQISTQQPIIQSFIPTNQRPLVQNDEKQIKQQDNATQEKTEEQLKQAQLLQKRLQKAKKEFQINEETDKEFKNVNKHENNQGELSQEDLEPQILHITPEPVIFSSSDSFHEDNDFKARKVQKEQQYTDSIIESDPQIYAKNQRDYFNGCFQQFHIQQPKTVLVAPFQFSNQELNYRCDSVSPLISYNRVVFKNSQLTFLKQQFDKLENQLEKNIYWATLCYMCLFSDKFVKNRKIVNKLNKVTIQLPCALTYKPKGALVRLYADVNQIYFCGIIGIPYINKQPVASKFSKIKKVDDFDFEVEFLPENNKQLIQVLQYSLVKIASFL